MARNRWGWGKRVDRKIGGKVYSFASKKEGEFAQMLHNRKLKWEYETEKFVWYPNKVYRLLLLVEELEESFDGPVIDKIKNLIRKSFSKTYTPDFIIHKRDGSKMYLETKGHFPSDDRTKMLAVQRDYPDIDFRMIFFGRGSTKLSKTAKRILTYADWCDEYDFIYSDCGELPSEWLKKGG